MRKVPLFLGLLLFCQSTLKAQEVALGGWYSHVSYLSARRVEPVHDRFFCATYNGLFSYLPKNDSTATYSKINGLHDSGISSLAYEPESRLLLLSYRNGNLDLVQLDENAEPERITEWPLLRDAPSLPTNRRSNQLIFREKLAYLSTPFGIIVLDPARREVRETYRNIGENGSEVAVFGVAFTRDSLYAHTSQGTLRTSLSAQVNRQFYGNWQEVSTPPITSSIAVFQEKLYAGVANQGVFRKNKEDWQLVYPATSQQIALRVSQDRLVAALDTRIVTLNPQDQATDFRDPLFVSPQEAILDADNNLWVADHLNGLVSNFSGDYRSLSPPSGDTTITHRADSVVIDRNGLQWIRLPGALGGGLLVKDPATSQSRYLTTSPNNGGLPSSQVNSLSLDRNGLVWFAADRGVGYFLPDGVLSGGSINATFPIFGQRKLLSNEFNTAIVTEPGDRKWVGTRNGLYLFSPDGTRLIRQFDAANSPLPSDQILTLKFDDTSGRLYIDTPNGLVSYRSDASAPAPDLQAVTIFPNPLRPGYAGVVGMKGLVNETVVKITDLTGRLVFETRSEGGTASWNLLDYSGRRARGGIYLVLLIAPDGTESLAGKLAIVE